jgi:hypothetical protein
LRLLAKPKLSYANVVSTLALFVALGGASYAAVELPRNSVGESQIRNGAVTLGKLRFAAGITAGKATGVTTLSGGRCAHAAISECAPPLTDTLATVTVRIRRPTEVMLLGSAAMSPSSTTDGGQTGYLLLRGTRLGPGGVRSIQLPAPGQASAPLGQLGSTIALPELVSLSAGTYQFVLAGDSSATPAGSTQVANVALSALLLPPR